MKSLKLISKIALCALISLPILSSCSDKKSSSTKTHALLIATSADNPPFTFFQTDNGKRDIAGFEVELAHLIGKELGLEVKFQDMDFGGLLPALQTNRADVVMALMTPTPERSQKVDFSDIYFKAAPALLTLKGEPIEQDQQLSGKRVGVQIASTHFELIKEISQSVDAIEIIVLNRVGDLVQELRAKRLDAILVEEAVAKAYLQKNPELALSLLKEHMVTAAAAFPKKSAYKDRFNKALKKFESDGTLQALLKKWSTTQ